MVSKPLVYRLVEYACHFAGIPDGPFIERQGPVSNSHGRKTNSYMAVQYSYSEERKFLIPNQILVSGAYTQMEEVLVGSAAMGLFRFFSMPVSNDDSHPCMTLS